MGGGMAGLEPVVPGRGWWLLGPEPVDELGGGTFEVSAGRWLSVADGLGVHRSESSRAKVTLVGYALDTDDAGVTDADVAAAIAAGWDGPGSLPLVTARFGGRWMVVVEDASGVFVGQDVYGLRRVLYGPGGWCSGSEQALIRHAGMAVDAAAVDFAARVVPKAWPGDTTLLVGVRRLLSSQVLDLGAGAPVTVPLVHGVARPASEGEALDVITGAMSGVMAAAARRFPVVVLLTGGADSRAVLASCRGLTSGMRFVTIDNPGVGGSDADVTVATELARALGLDHHVVRSAAVASAGFATLAAEHSSPALPIWAANNEAVAPVVPPGAVGVTGHFGELWRGSFTVRPAPGTVPDVDWYLPSRRCLGEPFAEPSVRNWFAAADRDELPIVHRVLWDLEFGGRTTAWIEATDLIWSDYVNPLASRVAAAAAFSLPDRWRDTGPALMEELARRMWPEVLEAAVLPKLKLRRRSLPARVRSRLGRALGR